MTLIKLEGICRLLKEIEKRIPCSFEIEQIGTSIIIRTTPADSIQKNTLFFIELAKKLALLYNCIFEFIGTNFDYFEMYINPTPYKYEFDFDTRDAWTTTTTANTTYKQGAIVNFKNVKWGKI